jgi:hypothetical protein
VGVRREGSQVLILIGDNGHGIPKEVLAKLGVRGGTYGKSEGNGMGLYHARTSLERWGGSLGVESEPGNGTEITLRLPRSIAPSWFASSIQIAPSSVVAVLDDDASIHGVWDARLAKVGVGIEHFFEPDRLCSHVHSGKMPDLFLLDNELRGHASTGLDVIEKLRIANRAILVTSCQDEAAVLARCKQLGVRLLPKSLAGIVPIVVSAALPDRIRYDAVLIDDDQLMHWVWSDSARIRGKKCIAFQRPEDFLAVVDTIDRSSSVYVDASLADGVKGQDVSRMLHADYGFNEIHIATGYEGDFLRSISDAHLSWVKSIRGKEPPFSES